MHLAEQHPLHPKKCAVLSTVAVTSTTIRIKCLWFEWPGMHQSINSVCAYGYVIVRADEKCRDVAGRRSPACCVSASASMSATRLGCTALPHTSLHAVPALAWLRITTTHPPSLTPQPHTHPPSYHHHPPPLPHYPLPHRPFPHTPPA
jgi:hypothetical protein